MFSLLVATAGLAAFYGALWHNQPAKNRNRETQPEQEGTRPPGTVAAPRPVNTRYNSLDSPPISHGINSVPKPQGPLASRETDITLTEAESGQQAIVQLLASHQPTRLLIDATAIRSVPTPSHLFDLVKSLSRSLHRAARVALVVRPDQVRHGRLIEHAARKAGAFLTYFTDRQKAQRWLRGPTFQRHCLSSPAAGCDSAVTTTVTAPTKEHYAV
jgi:hypothetical protein